MFNMAKSAMRAFGASSKRGRAPIDIQKQSLVNYVWINRVKDNKDTSLIGTTFEPELCTVPLQNLDRAYENARRYPDAQFKIWIDLSLLDDQSRFFFQAHQYINAPDNVEVVDLSQWPEYAEHPFMNVEWPVFSRVDLLRLMVIKHGFETTSYTDIYYSDFDLKDVGILKPGVQKDLNERGAVQGCTYYAGVENGYFGFRRGKIQEELDKLISRTQDSVRTGGNGYTAAVRFYKSWRSHPKFKNLRKHHRNPIKLKEVGYEVPKPKLYDEMRIC